MCSLRLFLHRFLLLVFLPQKMFQVEGVNCICVDWRQGAKADYTQAVHNIRVVGAEIALLVQGLTVKPPGPIPWGGAERGQRGAGKRQGAPRGAWGLVGRAWAWSSGGREAFPKMKLQPSPSWSVLKAPSCGAWGELTTLNLGFPF